MNCNICNQNTITPVGTCSNLQCPSNHKRELSSLEILEKFIYDGTPPDKMGMEYNNSGIIYMVFRWDTGPFLYLRYDVQSFLVTLARFMDFWGTCIPGQKLNVKEKKGGKSDGAGN